MKNVNDDFSNQVKSTPIDQTYSNLSINESNPERISNLMLEIRDMTKKAVKKNNVFFLLLHFLYPVFFMMGITMLTSYQDPSKYDANFVVEITAYNILNYPTFYVVSVILSWILFFNKKYKLAVISSKLPFVNFFITILGLAIYFII